MLDAQGRVVFDGDNRASTGLAGVPRSPSGEWRLRSRLGEWPLSVIQLNWLNRDEADSIARDRDYTVRWDHSGTRLGDRVDLVVFGVVDKTSLLIECAAEASRGTLSVPASLLRQVSEQFPEARATLFLQMSRPTQTLKLGLDAVRYLVITNQSEEFRSLVLP